MENKLANLDDNSLFYRGTIIVLKNLHKSPVGYFDVKYAMIGGAGQTFRMLDLFKSIGGCIMHDLKPNVVGHVAVDKAGIYTWVTEHLEMFYMPEFAKTIDHNEQVYLNELVYIDNLDQHFVQANRDLFMGLDIGTDVYFPNEIIVDLETASLNPHAEPIITINKGGELTGNDEIKKEEINIKDDPNYKKYKKELNSCFDENSREFKSLFLLHKHLTETSTEELEKEWKAVEDMGFQGPTVEEYFQSINPAFQRQKGYSEGAAKFRDEMIKEIEAYHDDPLESSTFKVPDLLSKKQVIDMLNKIYDTK